MSQQNEKVVTRSDQPTSSLPEWMRNPEPARATTGQRISAALNQRGWWRPIRQGWWRWQTRRRLSDRFPVTSKITAVLLSMIIAVAAYLGIYRLFVLL